MERGISWLPRMMKPSRRYSCLNGFGGIYSDGGKWGESGVCDEKHKCVDSEIALGKDLESLDTGLGRGWPYFVGGIINGSDGKVKSQVNMERLIISSH